MKLLNPEYGKISVQSKVINSLIIVKLFGVAD
jgi:hypothetical protein